jgi:hypothetical protein
MSNSINFFKGLITESIMNLHTAMPCKVLNYDESSRRAKIQPLFMMKEIGEEPEALKPIENVPVLYQRYKLNNNEPISVETDTGEHSQYQGSGAHNHNSLTYTQSVEMVPDLRSGDVVLAVFCQRAIDGVLDGKIAYPDASRTHDVHDAVIVGVIT